jgi:hypothetical protein
VRYDVARDEAVRGADGFCVRVEVGEPGELLISARLGAEFRGYADETDSRRKLLFDVFEKGDFYTRMGDLMRVDAAGSVYFVDRIGDMFQWGGTNISTVEVASEISRYEGVQEVCVYGVWVPGRDTCRAGMCAMVTPDLSKANLSGLRRHAIERVGAHALPVFLRALRQIPTTASVVHRKVELKREAMNPVDVPEPVFTLIDNEYCLMDSATYQHIDKVVDEFARDLQCTRMDSARMLASVAEEPADTSSVGDADAGSCAVPVAEHGVEIVANTLASPLPAQRGRKEVRIATPTQNEEQEEIAAGEAPPQTVNSVPVAGAACAGSVGQCSDGASVGSPGEEVDSSPSGLCLGKLIEEVHMAPNLAVGPSKVASQDLFEENVVLRKKIEKLE